MMLKQTFCLQPANVETQMQHKGWEKYGSLHKKMNFSIKDFFIKCDQIHGKLRIWSHLLKQYLMEKFIFCAVGEEHP